MICVFENTIDDVSIRKLLEYWYNHESKSVSILKKYNSYSLNIIEIQDILSTFNIKKTFPIELYSVCYLQYIDESYGKTNHDNKYHNHNPLWTYVQYLNDNYDGGEIHFESGFKYKPKKGDMVCFTGDEPHKATQPYNFKKEYIQTETHNILLNRRWAVAGMMLNHNDYFQNNILPKNIL